MQRLYRDSRALTANCTFQRAMANPNSPPNSGTSPSNDASGETDDANDLDTPACVLSFNAVDASGAAGMAADLAAIGSVGGHALPVVTGAYTGDTAEIFDFYCMDDDAISEQARGVLEDMEVLAIKVGFLGSPEAIGVVSAIASDYPEVPLIAYMPSLAWWQDSLIESYLDAFSEMLLPQTTVLVGNHSTLWRWLLPDWAGARNPGARDIAKAAAECGVPYTLVTGIPLPDQHIENQLVTPQAVLVSEKFERFEANFHGAGDTLSAALAALIATGVDLAAATTEALTYLDRCLDAGFRPGMGRFVPDRMFWAQGDDDDDDQEAMLPLTANDLQLPDHSIKH